MKLLKFCKEKQITEALNVNRVTLYRWVKKGMFPAPKRQGNRNYWLVDEVNEWMMHRVVV